MTPLRCGLAVATRPPTSIWASRAPEPVIPALLTTSPPTVGPSARTPSSRLLGRVDRLDRVDLLRGLDLLRVQRRAHGRAVRVGLAFTPSRASCSTTPRLTCCTVSARAASRRRYVASRSSFSPAAGRGGDGVGAVSQRTVCSLSAPRPSCSARRGSSLPKGARLASSSRPPASPRQRLRLLVEREGVTVPFESVTLKSYAVRPCSGNSLGDEAASGSESGETPACSATASTAAFCSSGGTPARRRPSRSRSARRSSKRRNQLGASDRGHS